MFSMNINSATTGFLAWFDVEPSGVTSTNSIFNLSQLTGSLKTNWNRVDGHVGVPTKAAANS